MLTDVTMRHALIASLALGAVMTTGDWLWVAFQIRHTVAAGIAHGALMCLCLGAVIGLREGRVAAGIIAGPIIGVMAAGAFYLLAPAMRMMAMFPAWMVFWICFALVQAWMQAQSLLQRQNPPVVVGIGLAPVIGRGVAAAVLSGIAFYSISGIWTRHDLNGPNYLWNFVAWSFAFFPGFAALFWRDRARSRSDARLDHG
jgi:hypothetical protein